MKLYFILMDICLDIYIYINFICKCDKICLIVINFDYVVSIYRDFKL